jgi:hypothetical protein
VLSVVSGGSVEQSGRSIFAMPVIRVTLSFKAL